MINQTYKGNKGTYIAARELGRGGEGQVFEITNDTTNVLKIYSEPLSNRKIQKLRVMSAMANNQILAYAAWPIDIVTDYKGNVCGFIMRKLINYVPLHMLFNPMDRKKLFPDKGYSFLIHVARNLATAFHTLHIQGFVIGDVNESNILINNQGMVAFIDCDSFQVKDGNTYFFCEVGVPRYTAPELLQLSSFENTLRTFSTDSFSMAILIFQLLFLGRHPFAGRNLSNEDIDEETAIKRKLFAYSLYNTTKQLLPPKDALDISYLSRELQLLFHNSFESEANRPKPEVWIRDLDNYLKGIKTCTKSKVHNYPSQFQSCIWCDFKEKRNILFFIDDSLVNQGYELGNIESFINGFKVEKLVFPAIALTTHPITTATPIDNKYARGKVYNRLIPALVFVASLALIFIGPWYILIGVAFTLIVNESLPWKKEIKAELQRRNNEVSVTRSKLDASLKSYQSPNELLTYNKTIQLLEQTILKFKSLPSQLQTKKREMEEEVYNQQLHSFLMNYDVRSHTIPSFGPTRKLSLYNAGIKTASDVSQLKNKKVQGIGDTYTQVLFSWQRQIISQFTYHPDNHLLQQKYLLIVNEIDRSKKQLEEDIKRIHKDTLYLKSNITNNQNRLRIYIEELNKHVYQAEADLKAFQKVAA